MRTLGFWLPSGFFHPLRLLLLLLSLAGCATLEPHPNALTADDVIARAKSGVGTKEIIDELFRTNTVIPVSAAEIVRLHQAGVPNEVLDYLQYAQLQEIRWRDQSYWWYGPGFYRGFGPCPFPPLRHHRGGPWGC
jgi:hypothetical protein